MSFVIQRLIFTTPTQTFCFDSTPEIAESIELVALALGAERDLQDNTLFSFDFNNIELSNKALSVLDKVIENIGSPIFSGISRIRILCGNKSLVVEGNDSCFIAFCTVVMFAFDKIIVNETVTFSSDEENRFEAIQRIATIMGILPYC